MFRWHENRLLKKALALYAGEHVLKHVLTRGEDALTINASTRDLTVMFIDLAAFTEISEALPPEHLRGLMASWFEVLTTGIAKHGGTVDTYVGDAVSAWWGAEGEKDHPRLAVTCARDLVAELARLNETSRTKQWPEMKFCIGIATGPVRLGTYGSSKRLRYSMLGDTVNLASRLCGRAVGAEKHSILMSETTQQRLEGCVPTTLVDTVMVKGRNEPLRLYAA
jgi:class 3 adenylate cyclase